MQEADGDIVISESESEELHMQEADGDIVISESKSEELHMQEADGDAESYCKQLPLQEDIATCEDLFLQKTNENVVLRNVSENPMAADGTAAVLNNCSSRFVMKDSGRLSEDALRNTLSSNMQIKLQTGVCKDPLLAAKRNSLGCPKQKNKRREKPRQLRQLSEQTIAIKKDAKKAVRALQCDDDVMNKVSII